MIKVRVVFNVRYVKIYFVRKVVMMIIKGLHVNNLNNGEEIILMVMQCLTKFNNNMALNHVATVKYL